MLPELERQVSDIETPGEFNCMTWADAEGAHTSCAGTL